MGKDIVDTMFGWVFELIGWIFKQLFNLLIWLIKGVFKLIMSLFRLIFKKESSTNTGYTENSKIDRKAVNQFYTELMNNINNFEIDDSVEPFEDTVKKAEDIMLLFVKQIMTNCGLTVDQKCKLLETLDEKIADKVIPELYNIVFTKIIDNSYKIFESIVPSPLLLQEYGKFKKEAANKQPVTFEDYFYDLFMIAGLIGSPNGNFSLERNIINKYNLPKYRIEEE